MYKPKAIKHPRDHFPQIPRPGLPRSAKFYQRLRIIKLSIDKASHRLHPANIFLLYEY